jgi:hypothetical protein
MNVAALMLSLDCGVRVCICICLCMCVGVRLCVWVWVCLRGGWGVGRPGLFRGVTPTVLRDAPYSGVYVALYEPLRRYGHGTITPPSPWTYIHTHPYT